MTVAEYWKSKGIDIEQIDKLIDLMPEDSEIGDLAKELMQALTDNAFE